MDFSTVFSGAALRWIPSLFLWLREKFTSSKAPEITLAIRPNQPGPGAVFQCKIHVDITNRLPGKAVRIADAYFIFDKHGLLKPDPKWAAEHGTRRFPLFFFSPPTKMHDWQDVYLRPREKTNTWIGVDPQHPDEHIKQAAGAKKIGRLYFHMTRWTDGRAKTRRVRVKL
jgi:hypothetical protein